MNLTFITSNPLKVEQLGWHVKWPIAHRSLDLPEIQSLNLDEVVSHKAKSAYAQIGSPVLVEDFSFVINALGNLPGPFVKYFLEELGLEGICALLDNKADRSATSTVAFGIYNGQQLNIFRGTTTGTIAPEPRGEKNWGSDGIFIPDGYTKTWGEMTKQDHLKTSIRRQALQQLETYLNQVKV